MSTDQVALRQIAQALRAGRKLSDAQVVKLAELRRAENAGRRFADVEVEKLALGEGEELWDFVDAMCMAVQTNRIVLADGSLDARLVGIYDEHVIVEDGNTGKLFMSNFTRNAGGEFVFESPVEVRRIFVPVETEADVAEKAVSKAAPRATELVEVGKSVRARKWSFLPTSLTRR